MYVCFNLKYHFILIQVKNLTYIQNKMEFGSISLIYLYQQCMTLLRLPSTRVSMWVLIRNAAI